MERIALAEQEIRNFVNERDLYDNYFHRLPDDWNLLTAALDTLGDSTAALAHFESTGIGSDIQEKYLRFYGMFQALILQQDAISSLHRIFCKSDLVNPAESSWQEVRRIRNMAIGHPLDRNGSPREGKLRIMVSQPSLSSDGFMMLVSEEKTSKQRSEQVDAKAVRDRYKLEALKYLTLIQESQKSMWRQVQ